MEDRKKDHIELAFESRTKSDDADNRFNYEPMLGSHSFQNDFPIEIAGKTMRFPIWVSSMTGGTEKAFTINHNLAKVCKEFGLGMGLGSCRSLLNDSKTFTDFDVRSSIGDDLPLFANLGIAQIEEVLDQKSFSKVSEMVKSLKADGLIIHVNPFQEWIQPGGDKITKTPLEIIRAFLDNFNLPVIVKEVGQGFGPESIKNLLELPIESIEFGAFGGTNFSLLELLRRTDSKELYEPLVNIGHSAEEMVQMINSLIDTIDNSQVKSVIISGGVRNYLDGYYLINKINMPAVYGQASSFLKYAMGDYSVLSEYVDSQIKGFKMANSFLKVR